MNIIQNIKKIRKGSVLAGAKRRIEKQRGTGYWLNLGIKFEPSLRLNGNQNEKLKSLLVLCGVSTRKENRLNLEILIANLLIKREKRPVRVSLNTLSWKITRYNKAGETTIKIINNLNEHGYIKLKKGYRFPGKESRLTRIWPKDKLLDCFLKYPGDVIYEPVEVVLQRDKDKNLKEYKDTVKTRKTREILTLVNKVNLSAIIKHQEYRLNPVLIAIFTRKFTLNGRLYTRGSEHYQGLGPDEREEITINGDSVVELDYSGLHPHLLYAKEGIQLKKDPYSIVDKRPEARTFLKQILLCMINNEDELSAERAANNWLYENHRQREKLKEIGITRARPFIEAFRKEHKPIEHHFCNGSETGLKIMNLDSSIALDIVHHFAKKNIPILAIHDSFIVQEKYKEELRQVMEGTYEKHTYEKHTDGYKCKIK